MSRRRGEQGSVTVFVVVFITTLILVAGLATDGGLLLAARRAAINEAEAAARDGAQAVRIDRLRRDGTVIIDPAEARRRVAAYLARSGHEGTVDVTADTVRVEVSFTKPLAILGLAGLAPITVRGRGEAQGIRAEGSAP
jgi:Putative Flp pilus-assembly TadE/G-like